MLGVYSSPAIANPRNGGDYRYYSNTKPIYCTLCPSSYRAVSSFTSSTFAHFSSFNFLVEEAKKDEADRL